MDETSDTQPESDTSNRLVATECSIPDYHAARQAFLAAVEEFRSASEEYLDALQAYYQNRQRGTSEERRMEHELLQEKMQKSEAALKVLVAQLELAKAKGEAVSIDT
jgi:hypothetical protein